jgi:hypothetical protein
VYLAEPKLISPALPVERGGGEASDLFLYLLVVDLGLLPVGGAFFPAVKVQIDAVGSGL